MVCHWRWLDRGGWTTAYNTPSAQGTSTFGVGFHLIYLKIYIYIYICVHGDVIKILLYISDNTIQCNVLFVCPTCNYVHPLTVLVASVRERTFGTRKKKKYIYIYAEIGFGIICFDQWCLNYHPLAVRLEAAGHAEDSSLAGGQLLGVWHTQGNMYTVYICIYNHEHVIKSL